MNKFKIHFMSLPIYPIFNVDLKKSIKVNRKSHSFTLALHYHRLVLHYAVAGVIGNLQRFHTDDAQFCKWPKVVSRAG